MFFLAKVWEAVIRSYAVFVDSGIRFRPASAFPGSSIPGPFFFQLGYLLKMPAGNDIWLVRLCVSKPKNWNLLLYKISCSSSYRWFTDLTSSDPCCWLLKLTYIRRACPNLLKKSPKLCLPKQPTNAHNHQKVSLSQCPSPYPPCIMFLTTLPTNAASVRTAFPLTNF